MHDLRVQPPWEDGPHDGLYALEVTGKDIAQIEASKADMQRQSISPFWGTKPMASVSTPRA